MDLRSCRKEIEETMEEEKVYIEKVLSFTSFQTHIVNSVPKVQVSWAHKSLVASQTFQ